MNLLFPSSATSQAPRDDRRQRVVAQEVRAPTSSPRSHAGAHARPWSGVRASSSAVHAFGCKQQRANGRSEVAAWEVGGRPGLRGTACIPQCCRGGSTAGASSPAQPVAGSGLGHVRNQGHWIAFSLVAQGGSLDVTIRHAQLRGRSSTCRRPAIDRGRVVCASFYTSADKGKHLPTRPCG